MKEKITIAGTVLLCISRWPPIMKGVGGEVLSRLPVRTVLSG